MEQRQGRWTHNGYRQVHSLQGSTKLSGCCKEKSVFQKRIRAFSNSKNVKNVNKNFEYNFHCLDGSEKTLGTPMQDRNIRVCLNRERTVKMSSCIKLGISRITQVIAFIISQIPLQSSWLFVEVNVLYIASKARKTKNFSSFFEKHFV